MAQAVSCRPLIAETWVRSHVTFVMDTVALDQIFLQALRFPLVSVNPPMLLIYLHIGDHWAVLSRIHLSIQRVNIISTEGEVYGRNRKEKQNVTGKL